MKKYTADFETLTYKGIERTAVWSFAIVEVGVLNPDEVHIFTNLHDGLIFLFNEMCENDCDTEIYFHNLKFDGSFIIDFLLRELKYETAFDGVSFLENKSMPDKSFKYVISDLGQWYTITIKVDGHFLYIRDSLKLLPFSVRDIGKAFKTKFQKLEMEYEHKTTDEPITEEQKSYIKNDVLVMSEALDITFNEGHTKLTIGSCCLDEFKKTYDKKVYKTLFPDLTEICVPYSTLSYDDFIRKTYSGGWCYVRDDMQGKEVFNGCTADVNSLYPSMMHSESGNYYPVGEPTFWCGDFIPEKAKRQKRYFFVHLQCCFYLKKNYLPFIHIRNSRYYNSEENLKTSDIWDKENECYCHYFYDDDGVKREAIADLYLTCTDYELLKEHYILTNFKIIEGCFFDTQIGIFDEYINKYAEIKKKSKFAKRTLAKLFLNNLYGKLSAGTQSNFKLAYLDENENVKFKTYVANNKKAGYIAIGSAITSYARNFTVRTAQKNYHGKGTDGFIYADTDSIHCNIAKENLIGVPVHPVDFCCWKIETEWDKAFFVRQKTYVENVVVADGEKVEKPFLLIKCAGMPDLSKKIFSQDVNDGVKLITDFNIGLKVSGKLLAKRIKGGLALVDTDFEMREKR